MALVAGAQVEMIGVAENDLRAEGFEHVLRDSFDRAGGADGHEDGSLDGLMRQMKLAAPAAGVGLVKQAELEAHLTILTGPVHHPATKACRRGPERAVRPALSKCAD